MKGSGRGKERDQITRRGASVGKKDEKSRRGFPLFPIFKKIREGEQGGRRSGETQWPINFRERWIGERTDEKNNRLGEKEASIDQSPEQIQVRTPR